jgi:hypothetical protein
MKKRPQNPYKGHPVLGVRPTKVPTSSEDLIPIFEALFEFHGFDWRKEPFAVWKLLEVVARQAVPALQPRKPGRRPPKYANEAMILVGLEFHRMRAEAGDRSTSDIIKEMAKDPFWRKEMGLGRSEVEVRKRLRYLLTDPIKRLEVAQKTLKLMRDGIAAAGVPSE